MQNDKSSNSQKAGCSDAMRLGSLKKRQLQVQEGRQSSAPGSLQWMSPQKLVNGKQILEGANKFSNLEPIIIKQPEGRDIREAPYFTRFLGPPVKNEEDVLDDQHQLVPDWILSLASRKVVNDEIFPLPTLRFKPGKTGEPVKASKTLTNEFLELTVSDPPQLSRSVKSSSSSQNFDGCRKKNMIVQQRAAKET
ncbi:unnamed protein product [Allacma fusca]|uniref:Uncharacterized protein n=1 Tax=Allacma fusca TaxID=39272 RepID=A0A8J2P2X3_9HEXA|nr:unnamed protein product [Allacma fusca]